MFLTFKMAHYKTHVYKTKLEDSDFPTISYVIAFWDIFSKPVNNDYKWDKLALNNRFASVLRFLPSIIYLPGKSDIYMWEALPRSLFKKRKLNVFITSLILIETSIVKEVGVMFHVKKANCSLVFGRAK